MDKLKFLLAVLVLGGAVFGFYHYGEESMLYRVIGMLAALGIATGIMLQTVVGQQAWGFFGDARTEARKVVWPSRKDTIQTTLMVLAMAILCAILLWLFDSFLSWAVSYLTGAGG
ncbi:MAG: preprotein translocase subunit SecE [Gammaproteobacteria bacterium]|nr:preprotein translocase subunit SecE [Gammaproteobacteria bacterium]